MRKYNPYPFHLFFCQYDFCWPAKVKFHIFSKLKKDKCKTSPVTVLHMR